MCNYIYKLSYFFVSNKFPAFMPFSRPFFRNFTLERKKLFEFGRDFRKISDFLSFFKNFRFLIGFTAFMGNADERSSIIKGKST